MMLFRRCCLDAMFVDGYVDGYVEMEMQNKKRSFIPLA
jgi:hypothetical protein